MALILLQEQTVSVFRFWHDGQLKAGIAYGNQLFHYHQTFDRSQREHACACAWLSEQRGVPAIVTTSGSQYKVWVHLQNCKVAESVSSPGSLVSIRDQKPIEL